MIGIEIKRGVVATFERLSARENLNILNVLWEGKTAAVIREDEGIILIFPDLDDTAYFPKSMLHKLIGYASHELGHIWFTDRGPWTLAEDQHGKFLGRLINGLEDPRIERCVYESNKLPNSRNLFESLISQIVPKNCDPNDVENYPFYLAVDGRRLNGYPLSSIVEKSKHAGILLDAVNEAHRAKDTKEIVGVATKLFNQLKKEHKNLDKQMEEQKRQGGSGENGAEKNAENGTGKGRGISVDLLEHLDVPECKADKKYHRPNIAKPVTYKFPWEAS